MSNFTIIDEASFFDEHPLDQLAKKALEQHGINIFGVYCLHTGKLIGRFDLETLEDAYYEEGGDDIDEESMIDALIARVASSMRPSPALNKPDLGTIRELVSRRPVDAMAYLWNRLYGNKHLLTQRRESAITFLIERIKTYRRVEELESQGFDLAAVTHWLLEIDSKFNLHTITPPAFDDELAYARSGQDLLRLVTPENMKQAIDSFEKWVFSITTKKHTRPDSEVGNAMTGPAYVASWLENPQIALRKDSIRRDENKAKLRAKQRRRGRPLSKKNQELERKSESQEFLDLLNAAFSGEVDSTPKPKPKTSGGLLTGGNIFKRKDS